MTGFVTGGEGSDDVLVPATHDLLDHTAGPLNLLDAAGHDAVDHAALTVPLMSVATHNALDHTTQAGTNVGEDNPGQVSPAERTAGAEGTLRSFSPFDIADMAGTHGGSGGLSSQNTLFSANLGSVPTGAKTVDFVFGFSPVLFAVPFFATDFENDPFNIGNPHQARITAIALNTPGSGTVRVSYTLSEGPIGTPTGIYDPQLFIGCSAFG